MPCITSLLNLMMRQQTRCLKAARLPTVSINPPATCRCPISPDAMRNLKPTAFMRKTLLTIGIGLAVSGATVLTTIAQPAGMAALHGHVPTVVSRLQATGQLQGATNLNLAIGLPLRNQAKLDSLLQQL